MAARKPGRPLPRSTPRQRARASRTSCKSRTREASTDIQEMSETTETRTCPLGGAEVRLRVRIAIGAVWSWRLMASVARRTSVVTASSKPWGSPWQRHRPAARRRRKRPPGGRSASRAGCSARRRPLVSNDAVVPVCVGASMSSASARAHAEACLAASTTRPSMAAACGPRLARSDVAPATTKSMSRISWRSSLAVGSSCSGLGAWPSLSGLREGSRNCTSTVTAESLFARDRAGGHRRIWLKPSRLRAAEPIPQYYVRQAFPGTPASWGGPRSSPPPPSSRRSPPRRSCPVWPS